jgi:hypothetical protein
MKTSTTIQGIEIDLFVGKLRVETVVQMRLARVTVEYDYTPGYDEFIHADAGRSEPGCAERVDIHSVIAAEPITLENDGHRLILLAGKEIKYHLTREQTEELEDGIRDELKEVAAL